MNSNEYEEIKKKHDYERIICPVLAALQTLYNQIHCLITFMRHSVI